MTHKELRPALGFLLNDGIAEIINDPRVAVGVVLAAFAVVLISYHATFATMVDTWAGSGNYAYGFAALPLSAFLLYRRRFELAASTPRPFWAAIPLLAVCVVAWAVGKTIEAAVVAQASMLAMVPSLLLLVLGPSTLRSVGLPLALAALGLPTGDSLTATMMDVTATSTAQLLRWSGIQTYLDGWLIAVPTGTYLVTEACSGMRYLVAAGLAGAYLACCNFGDWRKRLAFVAFALLVAIVGNIARAYLIVILAHFAGIDLAAEVDHFAYGWIMFLLLFMVILVVGRVLADPPPKDQSVFSSRPLMIPTILGNRMAFLTAACSGLAILLSGPMITARWTENPRHEERWIFPTQIGAARPAKHAHHPAWLRDDTGWEQLSLDYQGEDTSFKLTYARLFAGRKGRSLVNLREQITRERFSLVDESEITLTSPDGPFAAVTLRIRDERSESLVAYWFEVGAYRTASPYRAKLMELADLLRGRHAELELIAVTLERDSAAGPEAILEQVVAALTTNAMH